jgi:hypothetical protein
MAASTMGTHYAQTIDRESAYEKLKARTIERTTPAASKSTSTSFETPTSTDPPAAGKSIPSVLSDVLFGSVGPRGGRHEGLLGSAARSAARSVGSGVGREILRGVLGSILGGRR